LHQIDRWLTRDPPGFRCQPLDRCVNRRAAGYHFRWWRLRVVAINGV